MSFNRYLDLVQPWALSSSLAQHQQTLAMHWLDFWACLFLDFFQSKPHKKTFWPQFSQIVCPSKSLSYLQGQLWQNCCLHHHHQHHNICPHHDVTTATTTITIHSLHQHHRYHHHSHCDDNVAEGDDDGGGSEENDENDDDVVDDDDDDDDGVEESIKVFAPALESRPSRPHRGNLFTRGRGGGWWWLWWSWLKYTSYLPKNIFTYISMGQRNKA